ncbi:TPA: DNA-binding protein [Candidatus Delongbacteria bacterium]|nr:DNA-binding protein [Candidatus Delongbacteria bacterium]
MIKFEESIRDRIYSIRGYQVMLDSDLAELYGVETKYLNRVMKRNLERFPISFCFQISDSEAQYLRCQFVTKKNEGRGHHRKYLPYVFTQEGVAMLSAVLRGETAVRISIMIIEAFIAMRKFIQSNGQIFQRLDRVELKQIETDQKFEKVFDALESKERIPEQGIFFEGQVFDAYKFVSDLFRSAKKSIVIIDNYIDDTVLVHLTKVNHSVKVKILTKTISEQFRLDLKKFSEQYFSIDAKVIKNTHDRFIIIDGITVYHFGASLKDLGKKLFGFTKLDKAGLKLLEKIK